MAPENAPARSRAVARLEVDAREKPILLPEFEHDVHDLKGLAAFAQTVFPEARKRTASRREVTP